MSKDEVIVDGLEEDTTVGTDATTEEKAAKVRKEQTEEEKVTLLAGVAQLKTIGVSDKLAKVLALAPEWNGEKETLAVAKEALIKEFGGSEELKNYIDGDFQKEILAFQGIAKLMPVMNNIKSFYARRENTTKKVKFVQVNIAGVIYNVDSAYSTEISALPAAERKALLLAHAATNKVEALEIF